VSVQLGCALQVWLAMASLHNTEGESVSGSPKIMILRKKTIKKKSKPSLQCAGQFYSLASSIDHKNLRSDKGAYPEAMDCSTHDFDALVYLVLIQQLQNSTYLLH
jgi:hypothetical protein